MNLMTVFFLQAPAAGPGRKHDVDYADSYVCHHVLFYDSSSKQETKRNCELS